MNTFLSKLWWVIKPYNKWHIVVYLGFLGLIINIYVTRPPSKDISDFQYVEGLLVNLVETRSSKHVSKNHFVYIKPYILGEQLN